MEALLEREADSSLISRDKMGELKESEKASLESAISYYKTHLVDKDLRTNPYQFDFKNWIISQPDSFVMIPEQFQEHCLQLQQVSRIYQDHFWQMHQDGIVARYRENLHLINDTEEEAADRLTDLCRSMWNRGKIRVDICYYAKATAYNLRPRPYTTTNPTHVVTGALKSSDMPRGNWLEMIYHESSHHLIGSITGFVAGSIGDASGFPTERAPRDLWHAYLFYFSGVVTRDLLQKQGISDYTLYMVRNRVFSRYYPYLDAHLPSYIRFETSLYEATKAIIQAIKESDK